MTIYGLGNIKQFHIVLFWLLVLFRLADALTHGRESTWTVIIGVRSL